MIAPTQAGGAVPTILLVDDEANIRDVVQYALSREGFTTKIAKDGQEALSVFAEGGIDLVILDVLMPELDGLSVCRKLRESKSTVPIIFLSSRGEEVDRILGLELGGDDYLPKPFSPRELATRVKAVLRRSAPVAEAPSEEREQALLHGKLSLNASRHEARVGAEKLDFTVTEFALLWAILEKPGRVFTRAQLIDRAYSESTHITERTIDTHIRRIRQKLKPFGVDPIETVHGLGYKATESDAR
jgi:two-component system OmpR family response regulator